MLTNKTRERRVLALITLLSIATVGVVLAKMHGATEPSVLAARGFRTKTLRERAGTAHGNHFKGYVGLKTSTTYQDVDGLAAQSSDVIIARAVRNHCEFTADEKSVTTNYVVSVSKVFKGKLKPDEKIVVTRPGGRVQLEDGSYAEIEVLFGGRLMMNKRQYVLFLNRTGDSYTSVGGPQGVFRITDIIQPSDGWRNHPVVSKYTNMKTDAFLAEVRDVTKRQKK